MTLRSRATPPRFFLGFWFVVVLAQLAGDTALFFAAGSIREAIPGLDLRVAHLATDSLHHDVARYLRDSLGVATTRRNDTLVVTVPPAARRSIDASVTAASHEARRASGWLLAGVLLLHLPLLLAVVVTVIALRARAREEENRALEDWNDSA